MIEAEAGAFERWGVAVGDVVELRDGDGGATARLIAARAPVVLVATPIGNLGDLSPRAVEALRSAALICCEDTRRTGRLLQHAGVRRGLAVCNEHTERRASARCSPCSATAATSPSSPTPARPGSATPASGSCGAALDAGYEVTAVPGPAAVVAALVTSGLPTGALRVRGVPAAAGRRAPSGSPSSPPSGARSSSTRRRTGSRARSPISPRPRRRPSVAVARELTKLYETVVRGTLGDVDVGEPRGEYVVVIAGAPAADDASPWTTTRSAATLRDERRLAPGARRRRRRSGRARRHRRSRAVDELATTSPTPTRAEDRSGDTTVHPVTAMSTSADGRAGPSAAFFDLDRTLISGSSAFILAPTARSAGLVPTRAVRPDAGGAGVQAARARATATTDGVRDRILGAVDGMRQDDLIALNAEVLPEAARQDPPRGPAGCSTCTATPGATPTSCRRRRSRSSSRWPDSLGMTGGIGTRSMVVDGVYTGELAGPFCYGAGQGRGDARRSPAGTGLDLGQCYAYSDSASDLPMLQAVGHPVAVNPDGRLEPPRPANGWPIVHFSQRTKAVIRRSPAAAGATAIAGAGFAGRRPARPPRSPPERFCLD